MSDGISLSKKSKLSQYFDGLQGKSVAVIGMGVSNAPLVTLLCQHGISVTVRDRASRDSVLEQAEKLEALGVNLILGQNYLENMSEDIIFRTPGLSPNTPELILAKKQGSEIISEMSLFFALCPCPIIGITGSDGKTTTTSIIAEMLKSAGKKTWIGGNIGNPLLPQLDEMTPEDWAVVELSSFQLMDMDASPDIAVFTNLSPNHLDYHHSMKEYQEAKTNIYKHQKPENIAVFNFDNQITRDLSQTAASKTVLFSRQQREDLESGVYLKDNMIYLNQQEILDINQILIPGVHNIENYMAAIAALYPHVISDLNIITQVARNFGGVAHRMQLVRVLDDVEYYNDSIGSSPTRTIACLQALNRPVILIAGGYDKEVSFEILGNLIADQDRTSYVKYLCLTGVTAEKIRAAVLSAKKNQESQPEIYIYSDLREATLAASQFAQPGDCVVLSPACASFDQFKNFVQRGNFFCEIIKNLK